MTVIISKGSSGRTTHYQLFYALNLELPHYVNQDGATTEYSAAIVIMVETE